MMKISLLEIVANPFNPRTSGTAPEKAALASLKNSIMAMPVPGSLAEPIQLIPLTKNVIDAFFGGIAPRGLSTEIQPKYMIFSGHRRYQAFVEIQKEALEMMATAPKEAGKLIDAYTSFPANVSNEEPGTTSDLLLRTTH